MTLDFSKVDCTNKIKANAKTEEEFYLLYASALSLFKKISGQSIKVFAYLLLHYRPGTIIGINKKVKESMIDFLEKGSVGSISNSLMELCDNDLLLRIENARGAYKINPTHAWKGSTMDRKKCLKTIIEIDYVSANSEN
jgi:hypothetical protein